ncbi:hypothetical protein E2P81_ATG00861 [Venturia nashicola]|uniref:Uncharacterized protein n=1 Tax=Venturia nashicola TaxID=86259 RepID=A0A4Z1PFF0_9PEZI|nr:hypothetical protein E6O75_ATG00877 [Venturia nashicola]TLD38318.1 hypothetical protein E2P81_ATG00861 [Venturia nashicola]
MFPKLRRQILTLKTNLTTLISPPKPNTTTPLLTSSSTSSFEDITPPSRPIASSTNPRSRAFLRPRRKKTTPPLVECESAPNGKPDLDECAIVESDDVVLKGRLRGVINTAHMPLEVQQRPETETRRLDETEVVKPIIGEREDSGVGVGNGEREDSGVGVGIGNGESGDGEVNCVDGALDVGGAKEELTRRVSRKVERKVGFGQRKVFQSAELREGFTPFAVREMAE